MADCTIRFVVGTVEEHSLSWTLRARAHDNGTEIYLFPREISNDYHVSLHKSGEWHVRIGEEEALARGYETAELIGPTWKRPDEIGPGVTLALRIIVPRAAISRTHPVSKSSACVFIPPPAEEKSIEVAVCLTRSRGPEDRWVGKHSMGTELVARCPISEPEWLSVVWREIETPTLNKSLTMRAMKPLIQEMPEKGNLMMMVWMMDEAGSPALFLGKLDEESANKLRSRWEDIAVERSAEG